jgi:hypothetical protein
VNVPASTSKQALMTSLSSTAISRTLLLACTGAWLAAQDAGVAALARIGLCAPQAFGPLDNVGLQQEADGTLTGIGPHYRVRFCRHGVEFTPVLGSAAPRALPLGYELQSVSRGRGWQAVAPAERTCAGGTVSYRRGDVVERYELRLPGVEQSFVFTALPPGDGDLVVRGACTTELGATTGDATDGIAFAQPGVGGVRVGGVVGIDAGGARCQGTLRWDGRHLDYVLPADFVARAALPLVVDPLIGAAVTIAAPDNDFDPDLAYDDTNNVWLVVWNRRVGGIDADVIGQRVSANGTMVGGAIGIQVSGLTAHRPRVANLQARDRFLVVWTESGLVAARSVDAATGQLSSQMSVAAGEDPVVAGDQRSSQDVALVVWHRPQTAPTVSIQGIPIQVAANGALSALGAVATLASFDATISPFDPVLEISGNGGDAERFAIVFQHSLHSAGPPAVDFDRVRGLIVDRNLNVLHSFLVADPGFAGDVDGDGIQWVVAWMRAEQVITTRRDILATSLGLANGSVAIGAPVPVASQLNHDEHHPTVAWLGSSALVAWAEDLLNHAANPFQVVARTIDPLSCTSCESAVAVGPSASGDPRAAARSTSGESSDGAAIVWNPWVALGDIDWQAWDAEDGAVADQGGGCGNGGRCHAPCAHPGNQGFALRLRAAGPGAAAFALFGFQNLGASCGSCTLVPDAFAGFVQAAGNTSAAGDAAFVLPLPAVASLVGQSIFGQWVTSGTSCLGGLDFSNGIRITIE